MCIKCVYKFFSASNGVKQREVLSPVLFTIYLDQLFIYADDVTLLPYTTMALKVMLNTCIGFAASHNLLSNLWKT